MFEVQLEITFQMSHLQNMAGSSMNHQHVILCLHCSFVQTKEIPEPSVLLGLLLQEPLSPYCLLIMKGNIKIGHASSGVNILVIGPNHSGILYPRFRLLSIFPILFINHAFCHNLARFSRMLHIVKTILHFLKQTLYVSQSKEVWRSSFFLS